MTHCFHSFFHKMIHCFHSFFHKLTNCFHSFTTRWLIVFTHFFTSWLILTYFLQDAPLFSLIFHDLFSCIFHKSHCFHSFFQKMTHCSHSFSSRWPIHFLWPVGCFHTFFTQWLIVVTHFPQENVFTLIFKHLFELNSLMGFTVPVLITPSTLSHPPPRWRNPVRGLNCWLQPHPGQPTQWISGAFAPTLPALLFGRADPYRDWGHQAANGQLPLLTQGSLPVPWGSSLFQQRPVSSNAEQSACCQTERNHRHLYQ